MRQTDPTQGELSFELLAEIAVGATARVELCRVLAGPLESELVAVKRLHPHIAEDPLFVDMFRDEVWMTAALKHPHVVEVVGWGQDLVGPWLAVEFVRGVSLQRLMKTVFETGERFSERMVVFLARCICDGLAEAHSLRSAGGEHLNLVHRDLTPGNILLGFDGQVKITDFGLAKAKQRLTKTLTGLLKGQPQYMSPEQVRGDPLDGRSDVFALGVVLFELFSGRRPWAATTDLDVMRAIADEPPADLRKLRPRMDRALVEVVETCLQKVPAQRLQGAVELRERFDEWLSAHGYREDNDVSLARFVRRNAMRQMRWFERAVAGEFTEEARAGQGLPGGRVSTLPAAGPAGSAAPAAPSPASEVKPAASVAPASAAAASGAASAPSVPPRPPKPSQREAPKLPAPPPRAEAPTRITADPDDSDASSPPDPDSIDWGDDGPTLVQRSDGSALPGRRHEPADSISGEPTTRRRRRSRPVDRGAATGPRAGESSELTTVPSRRALEKRHGRSGSSEAADRTAQLDPVVDAPAAKTSGPDLGVVAPPDPDVPPLPPGKESAPRAPTSPTVGTNDTSTTRPLPMEELGIDPRSVESFDAAAGRGMAAAQPPPGLGAMPAPRFPSLPSLDGELRSSDFGAEAQRLAAAAERRREEAHRSAEMAQAAERVAGLAQEAALLAARGRAPEAIGVLRQAQTLDEALGRGDVPAAALAPEPAVSTVQGLLQSFGLRPRGDTNLLASGQTATLVVVVSAVGLLLVALLLALLL